jgi:hypothetical protein
MATVPVDDTSSADRRRHLTFGQDDDKADPASGTSGSAMAAANTSPGRRPEHAT